MQIGGRMMQLMDSNKTLARGKEKELEEFAENIIRSVYSGFMSSVELDIKLVRDGIEVKDFMDEEDEKKKEEEEMKKKIAEMEGRFSAYDASFSALQSDYESLKAAFGKQGEAMQGLINLVETLVNVPSQAPAEVPNNFKKVSVQTKADRIRNYSNFVSQFKNK
jgi:MoaA/NifB/PqqE/SkfB family radical SAM enzyme